MLYSDSLILYRSRCRVLMQVLMQNLAWFDKVSLCSAVLGYLGAVLMDCGVIDWGMNLLTCKNEKGWHFIMIQAMKGLNNKTKCREKEEGKKEGKASKEIVRERALLCPYILPRILQSWIWIPGVTCNNSKLLNNARKLKIELSNSPYNSL